MDFLDQGDLVAVTLQETAQLIAKQSGMKLDDIQASISFAFDPNLDIGKFADSIRRQETQHRKDGRLDYATPVPMEKIVDQSPAKKAMAAK